jgi:hypothetical protein
VRGISRLAYLLLPLAIRMETGSPSSKLTSSFSSPQRFESSSRSRAFHDQLHSYAKPLSLFCSWHRSKNELQSELNQPWIIDDLRNLTKSWRVGERPGEGKLRMIENVEHLSTENQLGGLMDLE